MGLGGRVTIGDVAARAGVRVSEAEEALNALAADCNASIQVSERHTCDSYDMKPSWLVGLTTLDWCQYV